MQTADAQMGFCPGSFRVCSLSWADIQEGRERRRRRRMVSFAVVVGGGGSE